MADIFPPDTETPLGELRVLINDTKQLDGEYLFSDSELGVYLKLHENVWLAAAFAMFTIASNEALVLKKIRTEDLQTDGAALANSLYQHAAALRAEGTKRATAEADLDGGVEIVDYVEPLSRWDVFEAINMGGVWP